MKKLFCALFILLCVIFITGCSVKEIKFDNKIDKYEQLSKYLISSGWEKSETSPESFSLKVKNILDDEGRPINADWYDLDVESMSIQRATRISQFSATVTNYFLKNDIATGDYILLDENNEWIKKVDFSYDFNSGILTIDDNSSSSICTDLSVGLKNYLLEIIEKANLNIEDFK